jgi:HD-GYP domain-containing protein (c-di-GMP phosphodiesterase class II)
MISTIEGMIMTIEGEHIAIQAGVGAFSPEHSDDPRIQQIGRICSNCILYNTKPSELRSACMLLPISVEDRPVGFVYLENTGSLTNDERGLIQIMANQCGGALENLRLQIELKNSYEHLIHMLALAAEYKDKTTGEHIKRIARLTTELAKEMGVPEEEAERMGKAARLHDVGKVGIPDQILQKPGNLTKEEFEQVKQHTKLGADILELDGKLQLDRDIALMHHEQWSGEGYPFGLKGEEIPLAARIVSVVDVFDALINERPYKSAWKRDRAMELILEGRGTRFDPEVVDAFVEVFNRIDSEYTQ